LVPKSFGVYNELSRLLLLQTAGVARDFAANDQAQILARLVDFQALLGSGVAGNCTGIAATSGTFSGSSATLAALEAVVVSIGDAVAQSFGWATTQTIASLLRQRAELSGSTITLWRGKITQGNLIDFPAFSSSNISAGYLFAGEWKYVVVALWGGGLEMQINPFGADATAFQKGIVGVRTFLTMDTATIYPAAFKLATSVS
jgi:hypothetical protein